MISLSQILTVAADGSVDTLPLLVLQLDSHEQTLTLSPHTGSHQPP